MNKKLTLAICQMVVSSNKEENLQQAGEMIRQACEKDIDMAILPEVFNSPYQADLFPTYAESYPGPSTDFLSAAARENGVAVIGGSIIEKDSDGKLYNSCFVFDERGELLGRHRKIHLFDVDMPGKITFKESDTLSPGNNITIVKYRNISIGLLICYDIRFPELSRAMALEGADLLVVPAAFNHVSGPLFWELMMRSRAVDQQVYIAAAASAPNWGAHYHAWGHSLVVDPWGKIIAMADQTQQVIFAELDFSVNEIARREVPLLKSRRSDLYQLKYLNPASKE